MILFKVSIVLYLQNGAIATISPAFILDNVFCNKFQLNSNKTRLRLMQITKKTVLNFRIEKLYSNI